MKQVKRIKKANKIIQVERWIERYGNIGDECDGITAEQLPNGKWLCEIEIPEVGIKVKAICKTEANAMLRAADKAYTVIKEFLRNNMNADRSIESIRNYEMEIGENGEFLSIGLSKKQREREGKRSIEKTRKSFEAVEKAIDRIGRIVGSTKNLVIHVFDRTNFSDGLDDREILNEANHMVAKQYKSSMSGGCILKDNLVIYVGYTFE